MTEREFIERYTFDASSDLLGEGGFGRVYRAYDNYEHEYVALKMQDVNPQYPELRLRNEYEKVQRFTHPCIARYKACYTLNSFKGETDVAVMKYYEAGSLDKLMAKGALSFEQRCSMLEHILEGIDFLHNNGIIHRDLKPQNILIVEHDGRYAPLITDFGISKQLDKGQSSAVSNSILGGTRNYASPEQLKESKIKKNTDLWSFGIIAYEMFAGALPFNCGTFSPTSEEGRSEYLRQVKSGILPDALNGVPEPWQRLIRACLVVDSEQRIAHVEDCLEIINPPTEVEVGSPEDVEGDGENVGVDIADNNASGADSLDETVPEFTPASNTPPTPPSKPKKRRWWLWLSLAAFVGAVAWFAAPSSVTHEPEPIEEVSVEQFSKSVAPDSKSESKQTNFAETAYGMSMKMIWVDGGTFSMGSNLGGEDERPVHDVTLDGYWIAETEVTQAQWEAVMGTTILQQQKKSEGLVGFGDNYPMYYVNYDEAMEFCSRLSSATGRKYTLPTDAQWEYAARGGKGATTYTYSGSNSIGSVAWYNGNSVASTHPVKGKTPNQLGLYDMSGNVWEWCLDYYDSNYYSSSPKTNPSNQSRSDYRVLRGGSWAYDESRCRVTNRDYHYPSVRGSCFGFRVVVLPE